LNLRLEIAPCIVPINHAHHVCGWWVYAGCSIQAELVRATADVSVLEEKAGKLTQKVMKTKKMTPKQTELMVCVRETHMHMHKHACPRHDTCTYVFTR